MTKRDPKDVEAARLLERILGDAQGDDAQLWALVDTIAAGAKMPADAFVVGEPVQVTAVGYQGPLWLSVPVFASVRRGPTRVALSWWSNSTHSWRRHRAQSIAPHTPPLSSMRTVSENQPLQLADTPTILNLGMAIVFFWFVTFAAAQVLYHSVEKRFLALKDRYFH